MTGSITSATTAGIRAGSKGFIPLLPVRATTKLSFSGTASILKSLSTVKHDPDGILKITTQQFEYLKRHVAEGYSLIKQGNHAKAVEHFCDEAAAQKCGIKLTVFEDNLKRPLATDLELDTLLLNKNLDVTECLPSENRVFIYRPILGNAIKSQMPTEMLQRLDFSHAYIGAEEWSHALTYAAKRRKPWINQPWQQAAQRETEFEYVQYLIDAEIPLPKGMLARHDRERFFKGVTPLTSQQTSYPKVIFTKLYNDHERTRNYYQYHITGRLQDLKIGQKLTIGKNSGDLLVYLPSSRRKNRIALRGHADESYLSKFELPENPFLEITKTGAREYKAQLLTQMPETLGTVSHRRNGNEIEFVRDLSEASAFGKSFTFLSKDTFILNGNQLAFKFP